MRRGVLVAANCAEPNPSTQPVRRSRDGTSRRPLVRCSPVEDRVRTFTDAKTAQAHRRDWRHAGKRAHAMIGGERSRSGRHFAKFTVAEGR
jgi:hypothetical protein